MSQLQILLIETEVSLHNLTDTRRIIMIPIKLILFVQLRKN